MAALSLLLLVLSACGGAEAPATGEPTAATAKSLAVSNATQKSAAQLIPVYRFYNTRTAAHFYTTSETEKNSIQTTMPYFTFDGTAFMAASESAPGLSPVYRFYNTATGVHFYTISEAEKNSLVASGSAFHLEGVAYYASPTTGQGLLPLYRFYVSARGFHFYTANPDEKDALVANTASGYTYEGIGYYVMGTNWVADKLPHTGLTTAQCYGYDNNASAFSFSTCDATKVSMSFHQDSARTAHNPMSYSTYRHRIGLLLVAEAKTNCVYDNVTGLYWEGKTDDGGVRDKDNAYTNLGTNAANDASGYVAAVNASNLCGFNDWRLPTTMELITLLNYGRTDPNPPYVDTFWFPNTQIGRFWSNEVVSPTEAWAVTMSSDRWEEKMARSTMAWVRLVRGNMGNTSGGRYSYTSIAYGSDAANNLVNDHMTGLQWRRCLEGQVWSGTTCSGTALQFSHLQALAYGENPSLTNAGWRVPNVKEGASLLDKLAPSSPYVNATVFPATPSIGLWTTTADVSDPLNSAYFVALPPGYLNRQPRTNLWGLRLVR